MKARISIMTPLVAPLRDLKPEELDVIQLVHNQGSIEAVLNKATATDLDTLQGLVKLVKASYLRTE